ncbi:unnamed protein product [Pedinophyceae sp. YPF-701]|nr:unnamed protein product [Pedinophyceae sp. YPF-701]
MVLRAWPGAGRGAGGIGSHHARCGCGSDWRASSSSCVFGALRRASRVASQLTATAPLGEGAGRERYTSASLTITNRGNEFVALKVVPNSLERYVVEPTATLAGPRETFQIQVSLLARGAAKMIGSDCGDHLIVKSTPCREDANPRLEATYVNSLRPVLETEVRIKIADPPGTSTPVKSSEPPGRRVGFHELEPPRSKALADAPLMPPPSPTCAEQGVLQPLRPVELEEPDEQHRAAPFADAAHASQTQRPPTPLAALAATWVYSTISADVSDEPHGDEERPHESDSAADALAAIADDPHWLRAPDAVNDPDPTAPRTAGRILHSLAPRARVSAFPHGPSPSPTEPVMGANEASDAHSKVDLSSVAHKMASTSEHGTRDVGTLMEGSEPPSAATSFLPPAKCETGTQCYTSEEEYVAGSNPTTARSSASDSALNAWLSLFRGNGGGERAGHGRSVVLADCGSDEKSQDGGSACRTVRTTRTEDVVRRSVAGVQCERARASTAAQAVVHARAAGVQCAAATRACGVQHAAAQRTVSVQCDVAPVAAQAVRESGPESRGTKQRGDAAELAGLRAVVVLILALVVAVLCSVVVAHWTAVDVASAAVYRAMQRAAVAGDQDHVRAGSGAGRIWSLAQQAILRQGRT